MREVRISIKLPRKVHDQMKIDAVRGHCKVAEIAAEAYLHYSLILRRVARDEAKTPQDIAISEAALIEGRKALLELLGDTGQEKEKQIETLKQAISAPPITIKAPRKPRKKRRFPGMKRKRADNKQGTGK